MSKETIDIGFLQRGPYEGNVETVIFHKRAPTERGHLAKELVRHFGIVAGAPDGEDTAGRSQLRLLTPAEVARRAWDVADELYNILEAEGQLIDLPDPYVREREKANPVTEAVE